MQRLVLLASLAATTALAQTSGTPAAQPMAMEPVVTSDAASKTVRVNFTAGMGAANRGLNYNGDAKGDKTLTVPLGWTVEVSLGNMGQMPHDFAVVAGTAVPADLAKAQLAFPNAATGMVMPGAAAQTTRFVANRPGTYLILCRVGRHAQNGMYVKLSVANGIKAATYQSLPSQ